VHTLAAGAAGNSVQCMPEAPNAVPVVQAPVRVLCADSEFRVSESECRPCAVLGIEPPAAENFGVRWR